MNIKSANSKLNRFRISWSTATIILAWCVYFPANVKTKIACISRKLPCPWCENIIIIILLVIFGIPITIKRFLSSLKVKIPTSKLSEQMNTHNEHEFINLNIWLTSQALMLPWHPLSKFSHKPYTEVLLRITKNCKYIWNSGHFFKERRYGLRI